MIGRWVVVIGLTLALGGAAPAGQSEARRQVQVFPANLYALPLPVIYPLPDPTHRDPG